MSDEIDLSQFMPDEILAMVDHFYPTATVVMVVVEDENGKPTACIAGTHPTEEKTAEAAAIALAQWVAESPHIAIGYQGD